jgi:hypothetical protein
MDTPRDWIYFHEALALAACSPYTLKQLARRRLVRTRQLARRARIEYSRQDLMKYLAEAERPARRVAAGA